MSENNHNGKPEIYALRQDGRSWQISRRNFLKAASMGAALISAGMHSRMLKPVDAADDFDKLCMNVPSHQDIIKHLALSIDDRYLVSEDEAFKYKCWNFTSHDLLGSSQVENTELGCAAPINGKPIVFVTEGARIRMFSLPDFREEIDPISLSGDGVSGINALAAGLNGDIFAVSDNLLIQLKNHGGSYDEHVILYQAADSGKFTGIDVISPDMYLFIAKTSGYGIYNLQTGEMLEFDNESQYNAYGILPGGSRILLSDRGNSEYRLNSWPTGETIWKNRLAAEILEMAVTPDGAYGILAGADDRITLISMDDGSEIRHVSVGNTRNTRIIVGHNGKKCVVSTVNSLLFINLPEFSIIGCPIDLNEALDTTRGVEIQKVDPETGKTITYTLPYGAQIPSGAVCICNSVAGSICSCVGYVPPCSCNSHGGGAGCGCDGDCSCDSDSGGGGGGDSGGGGGGDHYWFPD